jgi:hypothetical protein
MEPIAFIDPLNCSVGLSPIVSAQDSVYSFVGFQFGMVMMVIGIACGILMGWGIHKQFALRGWG